MKTVLIVTSALLLASCASLNQGVSRVSASEQLATACQAAPAVHVAFVAIASQTTISQEILNREEQAYTVLRQVCTDRPANVEQALETALRAYRSILDAQKIATVAAERT